MRVAAGRGQIPARVDDRDFGVMETAGEPVGSDEEILHGVILTPVRAFPAIGDSTFAGFGTVEVGAS
jgi:hypothetical protein